ncbi:hypothetical protein ACROYT_G003667 [Oculina patagonica]
MAEENDKNTYGAVENTRPLNEDEQQERVRSVDSFYEDQPGENDDKRTLLDTDAEKGHLHEKQVEKQEEKPNKANGNAQNHQHNNNGITPTERLQRPTRVSFSKEQPKNANNGAVTPVTPIGRHVSFINEANQNEPNDVGVAYDNRACSEMQSSSDSLSRVQSLPRARFSLVLSMNRVLIFEFQGCCHPTKFEHTFRLELDRVGFHGAAQTKTGKRPGEVALAIPGTSWYFLLF